MERTSREYNPAKAKFGLFLSPTLATPTIKSVKCKHSPVYGVL